MAADFPADFLGALDTAVLARAGRPDSGELRFRCPAEGHPDEHPSARWNRQKATWCCDVCKAGGGALDLADRLGIEKPRRSESTVHKPTIVNTYDYHDSESRLLFQVVRYAPKAFKQRRPDGRGDWVWNLDSVEPVLYRLPELLADPDRWVALSAGEKDADRLCELGFLATTAPMGEGEGKWRATYTETLRGRAVVILADNDATGRTHAHGVAAALVGVARCVKVVCFPELPEKGDVSDWLDLGHTKDDLIRRMKATPDWAAEPVPLDKVHTFLGRFVAYPSVHAHVAHTLWVAHAHLMEAWESTPRLAALSPEPASGKTRLLEVTELLVPNPVEAINVTPAYLFRKVGHDDGRPTILYDEIDTVFGPKAKDNEEIRGLLNAGHRRGAVAGRCVVRGKLVETEEIPAYCAVALAGLGGLPDTILSRSVIIRMRRRAAGERVEPYRRRVHVAEGHALRERLAAWAATVVATVTEAWPVMPAGIEDRDSDVWEPLLAVADAAGGGWPERARGAAVAMVADAKERAPSLGVRLLADLRTVFGDTHAMATEDILRALQGLDEAPWGELVGGKPLNPRGLAQRLSQYGVKSKTVRIGKSTPRGYAREDLGDAWRRYLPPLHQNSATSATDGQSDGENAHSFEGFAQNGHRAFPDGESATLPQHRITSATDFPHHDGPVADVADVVDSAGSVCVQCGVPVTAPEQLYCPRHGGRSGPRSTTCRMCGTPLLPGVRDICAECEPQLVEVA